MKKKERNKSKAENININNYLNEICCLLPITEKYKHVNEV